MAKLITVHNTKGMAYKINPEYIVSILPSTKDAGCTRIFMEGQQRWIPVAESMDEVERLMRLSEF